METMGVKSEEGLTRTGNGLRFLTHSIWHLSNHPDIVEES